LIRGYLGHGDVILWDCGIGNGRRDIYLSPWGGHRTQHQYNIMVRGYNLELRTARALVENSYGRLKGRYKIFKVWRRRLTMLSAYYKLAVALTNIDCTYGGHPLRHRCEPGALCPVCAIQFA
jgi:hypothetical protein